MAVYALYAGMCKQSLSPSPDVELNMIPMYNKYWFPPCDRTVDAAPPARKYAGPGRAGGDVWEAADQLVRSKMSKHTVDEKQGKSQK